MGFGFFSPEVRPMEVDSAMLAGPPEPPRGLREPEAVGEFTRRHGIEEILTESIRLAREVFPAVKEVRTEVTEDPDEAVEWMTVRVIAAAAYPELAQAYHEYLNRWIKAAPAARRLLVRLTYAVG
jgi:alkanesulfonate monooxygenase SsuD/methylene tetrahydromethanopterin reductase-like flavin-dependent oxidoreductase (luciferase family)